MTPKRVIVHADDFGLHPAINAGIETAHREGLVTSASLMPLGAAFGNALERIKSLPDLDVGLHFTLVGVPDLPPTLGAFLAAYGSGQMPASRLETLLARQFDAVRHLPISHIDSHQHLHALPGVMRVVCRFAARNGIGAIRLPADSPALAVVPGARRVQAAMLAVMARLSRRFIDAYGLQTSDHFSGMAVSGHLTTSTLAAYLQNAQPGSTEIVCHPGSDNSALSQQFGWGYDWETETAALCSADARTALGGADTQQIGWRDLMLS